MPVRASALVRVRKRCLFAPAATTDQSGAQARSEKAIIVSRGRGSLHVHIAETGASRREFRLGSATSFLAATHHFRFSPDSGHIAPLQRTDAPDQSRSTADDSDGREATAQHSDRRYIGDKCHKVTSSLIRSVAIDCSLYASDFAWSWRRWVCPIEPGRPKACTSERSDFRASNDRRSRSQRYRDDLSIKGQDNERAGTTTRWQERCHDDIHSHTATIDHGE